MTLPTITQDLADSLPVFVASARSVREYRGVMAQTAETHTLDPNTGLDWKEITLAQLTAQSITETTDLQNPQTFSDTALTIEPTLVGIPTLVTTRTTRKISRLTVMEMGALSQNAMVRKNDIDGITVIAAFGTNAGPGAGTTLSHTFLRHMTYNIRGNTTEPAPDNAPVFIVLHSFQISDIEDELVASVGTDELTQGISAQVFANSFEGRVASAAVLRDDNIPINSADDASGGTFSRAALLLIRGTSPYVLTQQKPGLGGGAVAIFHYDEYAWGERTSQGTSVWGHTVTSDATAPAVT